MHFRLMKLRNDDLTLYLDAQSLAVQINGDPDGTGPRIEVKQGSSCQGKQGDDGRGRERGEQQLEKEVHGAAMQ